MATLSPTRRQIIVGSAAFLLWQGLGRAAEDKDPPRIRLDVATPAGKAQLVKYARAVKLMNDGDVPEADPRSWTYQWYIHAVPNTLNGNAAGKNRELDRVFGKAPTPARTLAASLWATCQAHFGGSDDMFLPWHRMYLLAFEEILRVVLKDPQFSLPYWDYTTAGKRALPEEFRMKDDQVFGVLYRPNRRRIPFPDINAGEAMDRGANGNPFNLGSMEFDQYSEFCAVLDSALHGNVHVAVGDPSNMGDVPTAAGDPVFWLHHCTIDRIWASWNAAGGKNMFASTKFDFADSQGQRVTFDSSDMGSTTALGYEYDRLIPRPTGPITAATAAPLPVLTIATSGPTPTVLAPNATKIPLQLTQPADNVTAQVAGLAAKQRLLVLVEDLKTNVQPGTLYELFIDLPDNANVEERKTHYIGTFNFFDAGHHTASGVVRLDATAVLRALSAEKKLSASPTLTVIPLGTPVPIAQPVLGKVSLVQQ